MSWTYQKPEPPPKRTESDWYWFWEEGIEKPVVVEVFSGYEKNVYGKGVWWDKPIKKPSSNDFKDWNKKKPKLTKRERFWFWFGDPETNKIWPTELYYGCWKLYGYTGVWWTETIKVPSEIPEFNKLDKKSEFQRIVSQRDKPKGSAKNYRGRGIL